jgi:hypothetical protein
MKANKRVTPPEEYVARSKTRSKKKRKKIPTYFWVGLFLIFLFFLVAGIVGWHLMFQRADFVSYEDYPKMLDKDTYLVQPVPGESHLETLEVKVVEGGVLVTWRWVIAPEPGVTHSLVARTWDQRTAGREAPVRSIPAPTSQVFIPMVGDENLRVTHAGVEVHYLDGMESGGNLPLNSKKY